jgi:hypothetical protein
MAFRRDLRTPILFAGKQYGTNESIRKIRQGIADGRIAVLERRQIQEGERLDSIAGRRYGRADLGWIIAAASNIGWILQVPPGIEIVIPRLEDVRDVVG